MAWYAPPEPPWDTCWDFNKEPGQKPGKGGDSKGGGSQWGKGGGSKWGSKWSSGWDQQESYGAPPWWQQQQQQQQQQQAAMAGPWGMPPWMHAAPAMLAGQHTPLKHPSSKDSAEPVLPAFLEKRYAERKGGGAATQAGPVVPVYEPPADKEYEGSVKSISSKHGYGFVVCDESHRIWGRDVYLPKDMVPDGCKALDRLRFCLVLSAKGHPQARSVSVVMVSAPVAPAEPVEEEGESSRPQA